MNVGDAGGGRTRLARDLSLTGLIATGVCATMGAGVNVVPFMLQRNVPGIGPDVLLAYVLGALPALLAAAPYAALGTAMPRAGGSYVYVSRVLGPYAGFVASFSQWFGVSMAIGVVAYVIAPFLRDTAAAFGSAGVAAAFEHPASRLALPLVLLWGAAVLNILGARLYGRTLVVLGLLMFVGGLIAIPAGFASSHEEFAAALLAREGVAVPEAPADIGGLAPLLSAAVLLFGSFIGFDTIAQAGGEAKRPERNIPIAVAATIGVVMGYYLLFTAAVYHAAPWEFVADRALQMDVTAPGLLAYVIPAWMALAIALAATIALVNDLPAMVLSVSRLVFAWSLDGLIRGFDRVAPRRRTPTRAIVLSSSLASVGISINWMAEDLFVGVDLLLTGMLVNFGLVAVALARIGRLNPPLASRLRFLRGPLRIPVGWTAAAAMATLLVIQIRKDLTTEREALYEHAVWVYLLGLAAATATYLIGRRRLRGEGVDMTARFRALPSE